MLKLGERSGGYCIWNRCWSEQVLLNWFVVITVHTISNAAKI